MMLDQSAQGVDSSAGGSDNLPRPGRGQTAATFKIQQELLDALEQASSAWLARVQTEAELWSQLATRLAATRSIPETLSAHHEKTGGR